MVVFLMVIAAVIPFSLLYEASGRRIGYLKSFFVLIVEPVALGVRLQDLVK